METLISYISGYASVSSFIIYLAYYGNNRTLFSQGEFNESIEKDIDYRIKRKQKAPFQQDLQQITTKLRLSVYAPTLTNSGVKLPEFFPVLWQQKGTKHNNSHQGTLLY